MLCVLDRLKKDVWVLEHVPEAMKNDAAIVETAVISCPGVCDLLPRR